MDVLIIPEAWREIEAFAAFRPKPGGWGVLLGHKRGSRLIVEKALAGGAQGTVPDDRLLAGLDGIWPGRIIGIMVSRPGTAFRKTLLGPAWFGKLVLRLAGPATAPDLRPFTVGFERRFFLVPIPFAPGGKGEGP